MPRFPVPAGQARVEEVILHSRFITTVGPAHSVPEAKAFVGHVRAEFSDATHNCFAYLVGPPASSAQVGMSDDGEPAGTAGRPMLAVLSGSGIGDIAAVVTRYFGGTKLGTGGLVRAYSGGVKAGLASLPRMDKITTVKIAACGPYAWIIPMARLLPGFEAAIVAQSYDAEVTWLIQVPEEQHAALVAALLDLSHGQIRLRDA